MALRTLPTHLLKIHCIDPHMTREAVCAMPDVVALAAESTTQLAQYGRVDTLVNTHRTRFAQLQLQLQAASSKLQAASSKLWLQAADEKLMMQAAEEKL